MFPLLWRIGCCVVFVSAWVSKVSKWTRCTLPLQLHVFSVYLFWLLLLKFMCVFVMVLGHGLFFFFSGNVVHLKVVQCWCKKKKDNEKKKMFHIVESDVLWNNRQLILISFWFVRIIFFPFYRGNLGSLSLVQPTLKGISNVSKRCHFISTALCIMYMCTGIYSVLIQSLFWTPASFPEKKATQNNETTATNKMKKQKKKKWVSVAAAC